MEFNVRMILKTNDSSSHEQFLRILDKSKRLDFQDDVDSADLGMWLATQLLEMPDRISIKEESEIELNFDTPNCETEDFVHIGETLSKWCASIELIIDCCDWGGYSIWRIIDGHAKQIEDNAYGDEDRVEDE